MKGVTWNRTSNMVVLTNISIFNGAVGSFVLLYVYFEMDLYSSFSCWPTFVIGHSSEQKVSMGNSNSKAPEQRKASDVPLPPLVDLHPQGSPGIPSTPSCWPSFWYKHNIAYNFHVTGHNEGINVNESIPEIVPAPSHNIDEYYPMTPGMGLL